MISQGDSLEFLKKQSDYSVDINYSDPPYGLGSEIIIRPDGKPDYSNASDFMSKWDMPTGDYWEEWFKESFRTLKHGGYCIMFGMDRQLLLFKYYAHLAGFTEKQSMYWYFISNFPKAMDLSRNIEKRMVGGRKNLKVIGERDGINNEDGTNGFAYNQDYEAGKSIGGKQLQGKIPVYGIETPLAKKYSGYKYSIAPLKQTNETIMIFQKPYKTGSCLHDTLAMENGDKEITCGAVDIEKNRVGTTGGRNNGNKAKEDGYVSNPNEIYGKFGEATKQDYGGRYPSQTFIDSQVAEVLDKQSGDRPSWKGQNFSPVNVYRGNSLSKSNTIREGYHEGFTDTGGCSKILHKCDFEKEEHDLYIYCPKVSKRERGNGLDNYITLKYNSSIWNEENMVQAGLLKKVISDLELKNFNIDMSGENTMVQCHKDSLSTIKTIISKITTSQILNLLMPLHTSDSIVGANSEMESGGNLAQDVKKSNELIKKTGIGQTEESGSHTLGVANAILKLLLLIKDADDWQELKNQNPCLKPIALNEKVLKLFKTPNPQKILYPFAGSGSEIIGGIKAGFTDWEACEISEEYVKIAEARINHWTKQDKLL